MKKDEILKKIVDEDEADGWEYVRPEKLAAFIEEITEPREDKQYSKDDDNNIIMPDKEPKECEHEKDAGYMYERFCYDCGKDLSQPQETKEIIKPIGVSTWKAIGEKYGYDKYFGIKWESEPQETKEDENMLEDSPFFTGKRRGKEMKEKYHPETKEGEFKKSILEWIEENNHIVIGANIVFKEDIIKFINSIKNIETNESWDES